ncbi:MAG: DNA ligase (NAD(+)) LigA, partial [Chitinophagaceae bacterium]
MYTREATTELQTLTNELVKKLSSESLTSIAIESLRDVLRFHEYRYYILNDPLIADFEYDQLFKALEKFEQENPDAITPDSPTQRVAKGLTKDFVTVQHLVPMLSLNNSYNAEDLIDFDR